MTQRLQSTIQDRISSYWNRRASSYDADQRRPERKEADQVAWTRVFARALPAPPAQVLDVGTGSGFVAFLLANLGFTVSACDLSEGMVDLAQEASGNRTRHQQTPPEFFLDDAMDPQVQAQSMDAITARYLMWTLPDPVRALVAWKRLLAPGGTLALVDAPWFPAGLQANSTPGFASTYSAEVAEALPLAASNTIEDTRAVVAQAGFQHIQVVPLEEIYGLDQATGPAPGHEVQMQYLITASAPA